MYLANSDLDLSNSSFVISSKSNLSFAFFNSVNASSLVLPNPLISPVDKAFSNWIV
ncbi:hypothetical protein FPN187_contig00097-0017 [Flavobacterium psychrophilum]|nr:hypothetical protein FPK15_contig00004-0010 [Flavobacterium psychrophilum]GAW89666.1 hypothetical protein FPS14_contig00027-0029 [Flavobacterium psychrophilum]GEJ32250.1 hypothetical protein FPN181_contig00014-0017 [Flavobacterium psychrophilum]GEJ33217.1 hypothetical protein FPN185_contig00070-0005 [Flavobacterium psychrophilum]GEJ40318.1 hypothetical protein FPN186_contig00034-0017 [Flavobacterium psychrophilum]